MEMMNRDTDLGFDDDLYYAELKRQILMLTADEEDVNFQEPVGPSRINRSTGGLTTSGQPWTHLEGCDSAPAWLLSLWRNNGSGTGVFIPHIVKTTRKHRQGRVNMDKRRAYKSKREANNGKKDSEIIT